MSERTAISWCDSTSRSKRQSGPGNPFWNGGRTVASNGYVLIKVGVDHHLSDVRGYAYEHRLVAEQKLGRRLLPGEQVHHINGVKTDNSPSNLEVLASLAEHAVEHRKRSDLRMPGAPNPSVECMCGCGGSFLRYDVEGRPRRFLPSHNARRLPRG